MMRRNRKIGGGKAVMICEVKGRGIVTDCRTMLSIFTFPSTLQKFHILGKIRKKDCFIRKTNGHIDVKNVSQRNSKNTTIDI
uniref:Bm13249, isoform a n=1 Tax=Brugia malayi TaxID=6279 RepID=A0A1I9G0Q4_BRUMA|nr:Bm13249, isoform a [Brugia malayi]